MSEKKDYAYQFPYADNYLIQDGVRLAIGQQITAIQNVVTSTIDQFYTDGEPHRTVQLLLRVQHEVETALRMMEDRFNVCLPIEKSVLIDELIKEKWYSDKDAAREWVECDMVKEVRA